MMKVTNTTVITTELIQTIFKPLSSTTHKGLQGHALLIGGSYGKIGAMVLASNACLKTGCGLVTAFLPECGYEILQISIPEVMVLTDRSSKHISSIAFSIRPQAIGIGPGMGLEIETEIAFFNFLKSNKAPIVIDADGLNLLSKHKEWFKLLAKNTIITPHLKELERLIGKWDTDEEKINKVVALSLKYQLIIVMKGAPTYIIYGNKIYKNTTGNAALATAGCGDVLTGIITSFLAQSYAPLDAAIIGVYFHGRTADIGAAKLSSQAFIASDSIANLGNVFLEMTP